MLSKVVIKSCYQAYILLLAAFFISGNAFASGNYHVEVVVFQNNNTPYGNNTQPVRDLDSNAKRWSMGPRYLGNYAQRLRNSPNYTVLSHKAWGQVSAPLARSPLGYPGGAGVEGWIRVFAPSLLFAELDLTFNGYRLSERRRLKLNEVHFFDSPGFGVLLRVSRS